MHSQVCFHRQLFPDPVKLHRCVTGPVEPLIRIGGMSDYCQCPSWPILWIVYISVVDRGHGTIVCVLMARKTHLPTSTSPVPSHPPTHPFIHDICDITGVVKSSQKSSLILHDRVCYETVRSYRTALLTYTTNLAWLQYSIGEPQLLQCNYFEMVFLRIQNCE